MRCGVIVFPGSNCDHDAYYVLKNVLGQDVSFIWHKEESVGPQDLIILPGGFSYGDALRSGAIARFSPIMKDVVRFAREGGLVIGICNGFQVLCESGLLPGALTRNESLKFVCKNVIIRTETTQSAFTGSLEKGALIHVPVAHGEGNYMADTATLDELEGENRIAFKYCDEHGEITSAANPNGSARNIAGILNAERNVLGMMPHPERCSDPLLGGVDGLGVFQSVLSYIGEGHPV